MAPERFNTFVCFVSHKVGPRLKESCFHTAACNAILDEPLVKNVRYVSARYDRIKMLYILFAQFLSKMTKKLKIQQEIYHSTMVTAT